MNFCIENFQLISVNDNLIKLYRDTLSINDSISDLQLIKNIIYYDILEDANEENKGMLDTFFEMVPLHGFSTPGEYIEFQMHCILEEKLKLCKNCGHYNKGNCISLNVDVLGNYTCQKPLKSNNFESKKA